MAKLQVKLNRSSSAGNFASITNKQRTAAVKRRPSPIVIGASLRSVIPGIPLLWKKKNHRLVNPSKRPITNETRTKVDKSAKPIEEANHGPWKGGDSSNNEGKGRITHERFGDDTELDTRDTLSALVAEANRLVGYVPTEFSWYHALCNKDAVEIAP